MKMTVGLALSYVCGCAECARDVENTIAAAIRDRTVTGVKLSVAPRCEHESADQLSARMRQPLAAGPSQATLETVVASASDAGMGSLSVNPPPPSESGFRVGKPSEGGGVAQPILIDTPHPLNGFDIGGPV